jgi:TonB family protein
MSGHIDILEQRESLRGPFRNSMLAHGALAAVVAAWALRGGSATNPLGDPNPGGGVGAVTVKVATIPIPSRSQQLNQVANDTESLVKARPEKRNIEERPDDDAIGIGKKDRKKQRKIDLDEVARRRAVEHELRELSSDTGARASSPIFQTVGGGQIGVGPNSALGGRFGGYVQLIQQCVGRKWREQNVDPRSRTQQPTIIRFDIQRNGSVREAVVQQASGNLNIDRASQRAVMDCVPFEPLPRGFEKDSATIEFWFQLKQ